MPPVTAEDSGSALKTLYTIVDDAPDISLIQRQCIELFELLESFSQLQSVLFFFYLGL
jgi:hypothetical protein